MPKSMSKTNAGRPFSGSTLKWLAIFLMFIDHVGASLIEVFLLNGYHNSPLAGMVADQAFWWSVDTVLRRIGRSAFPIFCFLLVEGAIHTHDSRRYAVRLALFAALSELPFNLALHNTVFWWNHQNVFFTLLLGLLVIRVFQRSAGREWRGLLALGAAAALAELVHTDYGATGVLVIASFYLLRERLPLAAILAYGLLILGAEIESWSLPGFLLLFLYNGKRGRQPKSFFYAFYPLHLLEIWLLGIRVIPAVLGNI